jgi:hypothetical protein
VNNSQSNPKENIDLATLSGLLHHAFTDRKLFHDITSMEAETESSLGGEGKLMLMEPHRHTKNQRKKGYVVFVG